MSQSIHAATIDQIIRWEDGRVSLHADELAQEQPLEIRVRGRAISVTMRTPGHDAELAAGFCLTEGIIHGADDLLDIQHCDRNEFGNVINLRLGPLVHVDLERLTRHVFASSSCGLCGKATIDAIRGQFASITSTGPLIPAATLAAMPAIMRKAQSTFDRTGGLHAAALFDADGRMVVLREDIGRHNAVDKVLGFALLQRLIPLDRHVLLISGRSSFEIMQKSLAAAAPIVAAVSAPSSLAVEFAADNRQTLVGFLREGRMNIYCGAERILF